MRKPNPPPLSKKQPLCAIGSFFIEKQSNFNRADLAKNSAQQEGYA
jgi:hypothetical protein